MKAATSSRRCARLLLAACLVCVPDVARAGQILRASAQGPGIAVGSWVCDALGVDFAPDGVHFTVVPLGAAYAVVDMVFLDDGTLLIATEQEGGALSVTRVAGGKTRSRRVGRVEESSEGEFVVAGSEIALLYGGKVYLSTDHGRTFSRANAPARFCRLARLRREVRTNAGETDAEVRDYLGRALTYDGIRLVRHEPGTPPVVLIDPLADP